MFELCWKLKLYSCFDSVKKKNDANLLLLLYYYIINLHLNIFNNKD